MSETSRLAFPAAPALSATVDIFNSVTAFGAKMMRSLNVSRVQTNFLNISHVSGTNGYKAYASTDGGANWDQVDFGATMPKTIVATVAGTDSTDNFKINHYDDFKLTYTNSANTLTTWRGTVEVTYGDVVTGT